MKVLSLMQPWASLMVLGAKRIETRSWKPKDPKIIDSITNNGLLIHASKKWDRELINLSEQPPFWNYMKKYWPEDEDYTPFSKMPLGAIIGKVNFMQAATTNNFVSISKDITKHGWAAEINWDEELRFGNYSPNRYGWLTRNAVEFETPIKCKGSLNLWDCPEDILQQLQLENYGKD